MYSDNFRYIYIYRRRKTPANTIYNATSTIYMYMYIFKLYFVHICTCAILASSRVKFDEFWRTYGRCFPKLHWRVSWPFRDRNVLKLRKWSAMELSIAPWNSRWNVNFVEMGNVPQHLTNYTPLRNNLRIRPYQCLKKKYCLNKSIKKIPK